MALVVGLDRWLPCLDRREYLGSPSRGCRQGRRSGRITHAAAGISQAAGHSRGTVLRAGGLTRGGAVGLWWWPQLHRSRGTRHTSLVPPSGCQQWKRWHRLIHNETAALPRRPRETSGRLSRRCRHTGRSSYLETGDLFGWWGGHWVLCSGAGVDTGRWWWVWGSTATSDAGHPERPRVGVGWSLCGRHLQGPRPPRG